MVLHFGDCEIDLDRFEVRRAGSKVPVEPQVFDVLAHLIEHRDRVVTKHELLDEVRENFVTESAMTTRIKAARRAVGDDGRAQRVIRTIHGRGYRFVADIEEPALAGDERTPADPSVPVSARPATMSATDRSWPLMGRATELDALATHFRDPNCGGVVLTGPAGMGKTRLAEESLRRRHSCGPRRRPSPIGGHPLGRPGPPARPVAHRQPRERRNRPKPAVSPESGGLGRAGGGSTTAPGRR
jgi:DNA-binding winged helix-turn-helix (wHTH) protein